MKQTTLLPLYRPMTPKKSPLPINSKPMNKTPTDKSPAFNTVYSLSTLSPIGKGNVIDYDTQNTQITPVKPLNGNTKRRSREVFEGITQSFQKKLKMDIENDTKEEKVKIDLRTPEKPISCRVPQKPTKHHTKMFFELSQDSLFNSSQETCDRSLISSQEVPEETNDCLKKLSIKSRLFKELVPGQMSASGMHRMLSTMRKLDMDNEDFSSEESKDKMTCDTEEKQDIALTPLIKKKSAEGVQISQQTLDIISSVRAKYNRSISSIEPKTSCTRMMEEKEEEPCISQETLNLIKLIKAKSTQMKSEDDQVKDTKPVVSSLKSASIREKYEELLGSERQFILPVTYKRLLQVFENLDKAIKQSMSEKEETFFGQVKYDVENSTKREVKLSHLAQILYVYPKAYEISWKKNEEAEGNYDLSLKLCTDQTEEERRTIFKNNLLEITRKHHNNFLANLSKEESEIDYENEKCWNTKFDVHNCPEIPEVKLPIKPGKETSEISSNEDTMVIREFKDVKRFSKVILEKARVNEHELAQAMISQNRGSVSINGFPLEKVAEALKNYYARRSVSSMFFINVVEQLAKNEFDRLLKHEQVVLAIVELVKLHPECLEIKEINGVQVLKMNKNS